MSMRTSVLERPTFDEVPRDVHPVVTPPPFRGLDGLRAIAVVAVIVFHLVPGAWPGGFIGVDVFFVISGFLITSLLLREQDLTGRIALGRFWKRRARRLLPALAIVVAITGGAAWVLGGDVLTGFGLQVLGAATFSANWLSIAGDATYFDHTAPELLRHLWSLGIEEQFYLVWPIVMIALCRVSKRRWRMLSVGVIAAASVIAMALLFEPSEITRVYFGTDTHSFPLMIGALLAFAVSSWTSRAIGWSRAARFWAPWIAVPGLIGLTVAFAQVAGEDPATYRGGLLAVALCTALVIAGAIVPGSWIGSMLEAVPFTYIGRRSYGLYLWHWPVFVLVTAALPTWPRDGLSALALGAIALVITSGAAVLSYRFVEMPMRQIGVRSTTARWISRARSGWLPATTAAIVFAVAILSIAATIAAIAAPPTQSSAHISIEKGIAAIEQQASESDLSTGSGDDAVEGPGSPVPEPIDVPGTPATGPEITAIGDSVMLASAPALQEAFPGVQIDAIVSRQLRDAPAILQSMADAGTLRRVVVVGLGTNGPIDAATLDQLRRIAGSERRLVVVSVYAPRGWTDGVNQSLSTFAQRYRDVEISTWREAISGQLDLLSGDQIHPGPRGGGVYASALRDALQRLADQPPLPLRSPTGFE